MIGIDFSMVILGAKLWIWVYFICSITFMLGTIAYFLREKIRRKYYYIRYPEKLVKVVIHYKNNLYKIYWRLIPRRKQFELLGHIYHYADKNILKVNDIFSYSKNDNLIIKIPEKEIKKGKEIITSYKEYVIRPNLITKNRWDSFGELHYFYNISEPLSFDISKKKIDFSGEELKQFEENDLFQKMLTLEDEKRLMRIVIIVSVITSIISGLTLAQTLGWFDPK